MDIKKQTVVEKNIFWDRKIHSRVQYYNFGVVKENFGINKFWLPTTIKIITYLGFQDFGKYLIKIFIKEIKHIKITFNYLSNRLKF